MLISMYGIHDRFQDVHKVSQEDMVAMLNKRNHKKIFIFREVRRKATNFVPAALHPKTMYGKYIVSFIEIVNMTIQL